MKTTTAVAIVRCFMGVWHVELERIRAMISGVRWIESSGIRHMPEVYWRLLCMLEVIEGLSIMIVSMFLSGEVS